MKSVVPDNINELNLLEAAEAYVRLGWTIHPLYGPNEGGDGVRGKGPRTKGWKNLNVESCTPEYLDKWYGPGARQKSNLGHILRPPYIKLDFDDKSSDGTALREWLKENPRVEKFPRYRTGRGLHVPFTCLDLPESVLTSKVPLVATLSKDLSVELYFDGLNTVVPPSTHKSGQRYEWLETGETAETSWEELCKQFGFREPVKGQRNPTREQRKKSRAQSVQDGCAGDLTSLDFIASIREVEKTLKQGCLGECLDPDQHKWEVRCPTAELHGDGGRGEPNSSTIVFCPPGKLPSFCCKHTGCMGPGTSIWDFLWAMEVAVPGVLERHCKFKKGDFTGRVAAGGRRQILLPSVSGVTVSEFGEELGKTIAEKLRLFMFHRDPVEIEHLPGHGQNARTTTFREMKEARFVGFAEEFAELGAFVSVQGVSQYCQKSMSEAEARQTLACPSFQKALPRIRRMLDTPIPVFDEAGNLTFPEPGYDPRFETWLDPSGPSITPMPLEEAIDLLWRTLLAPADQGGFCWRSEQSRIHALARLLTGFTRGIRGWQQPPVTLFVGNREGVGKDACATVAPIVLTGRPCISAPLMKDSEDEMRKTITATILSGAPYKHFANLRGRIQSAALEAATDGLGTWSDRRLGISENLELYHDTEFSLSVNHGTWTPDLERRSRRIELHYGGENLRERRFKIPNLHGWLVENRAKILSALFAIVKHWDEKGRPKGPTRFPGFPHWADVVGGILVSCGFGDPCLAHEQDPEDDGAYGDTDTAAIRLLCQSAHEKFGEEWVQKEALYEFVEGSEELRAAFGWIKFDDSNWRAGFGKLLRRYKDRILGGIQFTIRSPSRNRTQFQFKTTPEASRTPESEDICGDFGESRDSNIPEVPAQNPCNEAASGALGTSGSNFLHLRIERGLRSTVFENLGNGNECTDPIRDRVGEPLQLPQLPHPPAGVPLNGPILRAILVQDRADLDTVAEDLTFVAGDGDSVAIALDIETFGNRPADALDPWLGEIRLLSVRRRGGPVWLLDLQALGYGLGRIGTILEKSEVIIHHAQFDAVWLRRKCGLRLKHILCTRTASAILTAGLSGTGNALDKCLERHLRVSLPKDHATSDWGAVELSDGQLIYAAADVAYLHDLADALRQEINRAGLQKTWSLESSILPAVAGMTCAGVRIDVEALESFKSLEEKRAEDYARVFRGLVKKAGVVDAADINLESPQQVKKALNQAGIGVARTNEAVLKEAHDDVIIPQLLGYRNAIKRVQAAQKLLAHVRDDGRVHPQFNSTGTKTGRFSCKRPNVQSVPVGPVRAAFVASSGCKLVIADYGQIELRLAAVIAKEATMLEAFREGRDLHRLTASEILGKPEEEVTSEDRQLAKAVNFGLLYGQKAKGLANYARTSYDIKLTVAEAARFRGAWFALYRGFGEWHRANWRIVYDGVCEVRTRIGRRQLIDEDEKPWGRFTACVNTVVQGGAADGMKRAIELLSCRLPEGVQIVATVHDELVVEAAETIAESIRDIMVQTMCEAMEEIYPEVPIEVEAHVCDNWGEK